MKSAMDRLALLIVLLGAVNYGCLGLFGLDLLALCLGEQAAVMDRIVYTLLGVAGLWCVPMLFGDGKRSAGRRPKT